MLSKTQISSFDNDGVFLIKNVINKEHLIVLKNSAKNLLMTQDENLCGDYSVFSCGEYEHVNRIMHFHRHAPHSQIAFLGVPVLEKIAQQLCGGDVVPTADMMIFKHQGQQARIPWHQDFIDEIKVGRIIAIGIYLDDSNINDGGVQFIKGSHKRKEDICAFEHGAKQDTDILEFNVKAGDIVIHDPMIVHRSNTLLGQSMRRTLYYEFRTIEHVKQQISWPDEFVACRKALMQMARLQYIKDSANPLKVVNNKPSLTVDNSDLDIKAFYRTRLPKISANYCQCL